MEKEDEKVKAEERMAETEMQAFMAQQQLEQQKMAKGEMQAALAQQQLEQQKMAKAEMQAALAQQQLEQQKMAKAEMQAALAQLRSEFEADLRKSLSSIEQNAAVQVIFIPPSLPRPTRHAAYRSLREMVDFRSGVQ